MPNKNCLSRTLPWLLRRRPGFAVLLMVGVVSLLGPRLARADSDTHASGIVVAGNARFTVITPTLIRLEFSRNGRFIDKRSYFAWHRNVKPPQFQTRQLSGGLMITTSRMKLTWRGSHNRFSARNLSIQFQNGNGTWQTWRPGEKQTGNLGGTLMRLDGCDGWERLPDGVVSRDGWFLFQDQTTLVSNGKNPWVEPRPQSEIDDWYFFGYGRRNYRSALQDLTTVSGRIPIPRRYMLGAWRSRGIPYTADEFKQLVLAYNAHKFPLDVLVMDWRWHTAHWCSVDWDRQLIPHPTALLAWLHRQGLHVTLSWHPDCGVGPWDSPHYAEFCRAIGVNPAKRTVVPFEAENQKYMQNYFKLLLDPVEKQGSDFWWLDGGGKFKGWLNALDFWRAGTGRRGASFSRWGEQHGGWGDQRYPIWFSGDTSSFWRVLGFEVYYNSTAGNVGADYWSNDIGGFRTVIPSSELFTRWTQFGALSPIFRTHATDSFGDYRIPWYGGRQAEAANRRAYDLRARLFPYIYTCAYLCWRHSLPLVRPLYLGHPSAAQAYAHPEEYQFGPSLLASPIVTRGVGKAWLAAADVWFPGGTWWNLLTNERIERRGDRSVLATADEIPVFVRGGVPLPMQPVTLRMAEKPANPLVVCVYPGPSGQFTLYEDDGISPAYLHGTYALTPLRYKNLGDKGIRIVVGPTMGSYAGQSESRQLVVRLPVTTLPASIMVNGSHVPFSPTALPGYSYDPETVTTKIRLPNTSIRQPVEINVVFKGSQAVQALLPDIVNHIAVVRRALAGAGQVRALWRFQLEHLLFHLQVLRSRAAQEVHPASASEVLAGLKAADGDRASIQASLSHYQNVQARAAALALANTFLSAAVKLRKAKGGILLHDVPRYYKRFGPLKPRVVFNPEDYKAGLMLHVLLPAAAAGQHTLTVNVPGLPQRNFVLPQGKHSAFVFLPFLDATQSPLYHFRGRVTLRAGSGTSQLSLRRSVDVQKRLLDQWSLVGPFALGEAPRLGGTVITRATLRRSYQGMKGKAVSWKTWPSVVKKKPYYDRGPEYLAALKRWIDLNEIYPGAHVSAFAVEWVKVSAPVRCRVSLRHEAGLTLWVNRKQVLDSPRSQGISDLNGPPPEVLPLALHVGWNEVAVRTNHLAGSDWGFSVRLHLPPGVVLAQSSTPPLARHVTGPNRALQDR